MSDSGAALPAVGMTAVGVAAIRAAETERAERLFADPLAAGFVGAASARNGIPGAMTPSAAGARLSLADWVVVRTRFLDDLVLDACARRCRQVVILGAGLDARAFRLGWPDELRLFEVDLPEVLEFKEQVVQAEGLRPTCERITVPVDLSDDWGRPLLEAGLRRRRPGCLPGRRTARLFVAAGQATPSSSTRPSSRCRQAGWASPWPVPPLAVMARSAPRRHGRGGRLRRALALSGSRAGEGVARVPRLARPRSSTPLSGRPATAGPSDRGPATPTAPASSTPSAADICASRHPGARPPV